MLELGGESILWIAIQAISLALLAGVVAGGAATVFRAYTNESIPEGASLILGLGAVGVALNTRNLLVQFVGDGVIDVTATAAAIDLGIFVLAAFTASAGRLLGDRLGTSGRLNPRTLGRELQSPLVRATGRSIPVTLPSTIDDIDGYDPVSDETKQTLAGETFEFPRGLTVDGLEARLVDRLKTTPEVGFVDLDLTEEGTVAHLGLGRRPAGIGATLPTDAAAVAVECDPALASSPGDTVQLWRTDAEPERVATGELRAVAGSTATVVVDDRVAHSIDSTASHRLVTLPNADRPDREFVSMLRRTDETVATVAIQPDSELVGTPLSALELTVVAIESVDGSIETLPGDDREIDAGESVTVIGHPAAIRTLVRRGGEVVDIPDGETVVQ